MSAVTHWAAGLALVTVGLLASPSAVPIYDGVGQPDQPYRYVGKVPAPSSASVTVATANGVTTPIQAGSAESGPQVLFDLAAGAFRASTASVTVTATPLAPDAAPPRGEIDGNVYRVTATAGATFLPDAAQGYLFLRAAVMTSPAPVIVYRATPTDTWTEQTTSTSGRDNMATPFRKTGDYAVVRLPGATALGSSGLSTTQVVVLVGGILLLLIITVLVVRRRAPVS